MPESLEKISLEENNNLIPDWLYLNLLINASGNNIHLPHDSVGWSLAEFTAWFDKNSAKNDLWQFYNNLLISYRESVVAKNATEYVKYYPTLAKIVSRNLKS